MLCDRVSNSFLKEAINNMSLNLYSGRFLVLATLAFFLVFSSVFESNASEDIKHYVFVPNRGSADIAVIDSRIDRVIKRIEVGEVPHQVAVSLELGKIAVTNTADDTVSIIDSSTFMVVANVPLDSEPEHIAMNHTGDTIAVGNIGAGTVSLVSLVSAQEISRVQGLFEPHNMTFSSNGKYLYVGNLGSNFVSVINVASGVVIDEIPVGNNKKIGSFNANKDEYQGIINITSTTDGKLGFAAYGEDDRMAVIDLDSQSVIKNIELGDLPWRAFATADGKYMLIPNNGDRTVSIISTKSLDEVARVAGGADMTGISTGWFDTLAYVISRGEDKAIVIDLTSMQKVGEVDLPSSPETGVITPDGRKLYVALSGSNKVAVIDVKAMKIDKMIGGVGEEPWGAHMVGAINYCH